MSQSLNIAQGVQYDRTLVLAIELSNKDWVLEAQVPGLPKTKAKRTIEPDKLALAAAIDGYRSRAVAAGHAVDRVVATYEAGWSGFWLARWLLARGVEVHVVQPSSVPVDRRMRRAKSDGIDAELLLRTLLAWLRGEPRVCSMVPIPDESDEDARRWIIFAGSFGATASATASRSRSSSVIWARTSSSLLSNRSILASAFGGIGSPRPVRRSADTLGYQLRSLSDTPPGQLRSLSDTPPGQRRCG